MCVKQRDLYTVKGYLLWLEITTMEHAAANNRSINVRTGQHYDFSQFILCWRGNYCFLQGNPKFVLPPNHVRSERTEPPVSKKNVGHAKTLRGSLRSLFQWNCDDVMLQPWWCFGYVTIWTSWCKQTWRCGPCWCVLVQNASINIE